MKETAFGSWKGFKDDDDDDDGEEQRGEDEGVPLAKATTAKSDVGTEDSPSPTGPLVMDDDEGEEVPEMEQLGSPVVRVADDEVEKSEPVEEMQGLSLDKEES